MENTRFLYLPVRRLQAMIQKRGMKLYWITLLLFLLSASTLPAQRMSRISKRIISFEGESYKYRESEERFKPIPFSHERYVKSIKSFNTARTFGYLSLGSLGTGLVLFMFQPDADMSCDTFCFTTAQAVGFIIAGVWFPIFGTIAVTANSSGRYHQKQAINLFNGQYGIGQVRPAQSIVLSLGFTSHGLGFTLRF